MRARGFTLVEVLVSLLVVAFACGALLEGGSRYAEARALLVERQVGTRLAAARLLLRCPPGRGPRAPEGGEAEGEERAAGGRWRWVVERLAAADGLVQLRGRVTAPGGRAAARLYGYCRAGEGG